MAAWPDLLRLVATVLTTMLSQAGLWAEAYLVTGMIMDAIHGQAPQRDSASSHPVTGMKKAMVYSGVFMGSLYTLGLLWDLPFIRWAGRRLSDSWSPSCRGDRLSADQDDHRNVRRQPAVLSAASAELPDPVLSLRGAVIGLGLGCGLVLGLPEKDLPTRAWFGFGFGALAYAGIDVLRDCLYAGARPRAAPVFALLPCPRAPRRLHRRGHRVLPRRLAGLRGRRQVPPLPRRGAAAATLRHLPPRQQVGAPRAGDGHAAA